MDNKVNNMLNEFFANTDAKNDEEVYEIISDIVSANNSRVQDNEG